MLDFVRRIKTARCVAVAYTFTPHGGSCVSINHFATECYGRGQYVERFSLGESGAWIKALLVILLARRVVLIGLRGFYGPLGIFIALARRDSMLYLQESEVALNALKQDYPFGHRAARHFMKRHKIACISAVQESYIREAYGARHTRLVYNTLPMIDRAAFAGEGIKILMVGYIMPRKGVDLYSKLADHAKEKGELWRFYWIGSGYYRELYHSKNVTWMGYQAHPRDYYPMTDLFFLASVDEPMGLVCSEALMYHRRCVVYANAGYAELIRGISGCAIYDDYTVDSAYHAIKRALGEPLDTEKVDAMLERSSGANGFVQRFNEWIDT